MAYVENDRKPQDGRNNLSNVRERYLMRANFIKFKLEQKKKKYHKYTNEICFTYPFKYN